MAGGWVVGLKGKCGLPGLVAGNTQGIWALPSYLDHKVGPFLASVLEYAHQTDTILAHCRSIVGLEADVGRRGGI